MVGGATCSCRRHSVESELREIECIHEGIDHANRVVRVNPILKAFGKQRALAAICTLDEALHPIPPQNHSRGTIAISYGVFTQPGSIAEVDTNAA